MKTAPCPKEEAEYHTLHGPDIPYVIEHIQTTLAPDLLIAGHETKGKPIASLCLSFLIK